MKPLIDGVNSKFCNKCGILKTVSSYNKNKQCSLGVVGTCKSCENERVTQWYRDNRSRRQDAANKRNRERKKLMAKHFGGCCKDCGVSYPQYVYEFHHTDPKQKDVNPSKALSWSEERMWKELNKCVMLCSNCHKIRHHSLGECEDTR